VRNVQERGKQGDVGGEGHGVSRWLGGGAVALVRRSGNRLGGHGRRGSFNLGQKNIVNAISRLVGKVDGHMLLVDNNSAGTKATALTLTDLSKDC
jgi:hypothetical protein